MASDSIDDLWQKLKIDFESKPYFFNDSLNDQRSGVMGPFIHEVFGEYAMNNALPLSPKQLSRLPEAEFLEKVPFTLAMKGRERLLRAGKIQDHQLLAVADFSKSSRKRRFYIFNLSSQEVLINTWTSHAVKSDADLDGIPETFSNTSGSSQTSVGFMATDKTYHGGFGYSLRLKGLDAQLNSQVFSRAVVIHGLGGLDPHQASYGNISGSEGCLMISMNESGLFWGLEDRSMRDIVIDTLKKGALVFVYTDKPDKNGEELIFKSQWIKKSDLNP
jgi:hypothetical protein